MDLRKEIAKIQKHYAENPRAGTFNALIMGESGTGKTFNAALTAPGPVHIDSFDKGGTLGLRDEKRFLDGQIICDTRWEDENPLEPKQYNEWDKVMKERIRGGYFNHFGTYILDSTTTWSSAIMNSILKKHGRPGQKPQFTHDYGPQKVELMNWIARLLLLPCHTIVTGHLELVGDKNEKGEMKNMRYRYLATGKAKVEVPLLFDEQWVSFAKESSAGTAYELLTQPEGLFLARSRLAGRKKLSKREGFDVAEILKKVGFKHKNKEPLPTE